MTFNQNADISGNRVSRGRSGARAGGMALGGLGGAGIIIYLLVHFIGGGSLGNLDLSELGLTSPEQGQFEPSDGSGTLEDCLTGADANERVDCRMQGTAYSLDAFWAQTLPQQAGIDYEMPEMVIFSGSVNTGCGAATSAVGPFYCPTDQTVYLDTSFFNELSSRYGASSGPLAELYVVAHEFGHHIQNQLGTMQTANRSATGPTSDQVRLELQADCYAGMWVQGASTTTDSNGVTYLVEPTNAEIKDALSAAAAVGDDHIQETFQGQVQPHTWTHGSSQQRMRWFTTGMNTGTLRGCDTFAVSPGDL